MEKLGNLTSRLSQLEIKIYCDWYQEQMRYYEPIWQNTLDPDCKHCGGKGWVLVQIGEDDVDKDICTCADTILVE
jgi:hypothetical protein